LDGDQRKVQEFTRPETIAPADYPNLTTLLKAETGVDPLFHIPGGNDAAGHDAAKTEAQLSYLAWLRSRVSYLPNRVPEITFLKAANPNEAYGGLAAPEAKQALRALLAKQVDVTSRELAVLAKVAVADIPPDHPDLVIIRNCVLGWLHGANA